MNLSVIRLDRSDAEAGRGQRGRPSAMKAATPSKSSAPSWNRSTRNSPERYGFSIGWGCDRLFTAADFAPVEPLGRRAPCWHHGVQRVGNLAGMGARADAQLGGPAERRRCRRGRSGIARDDRRRRDQTVHRRRTAAGSPNRPGTTCLTILRHRRRGVVTLRTYRWRDVGPDCPRPAFGWMSPRSPTLHPASGSCSTGRWPSAGTCPRRRRSGPAWRH